MNHDPNTLRAYYANLIVGQRTGIRDARLIAAFEAVPRERFAGPGPWKVFVRAGKYIDTPSDDLCFLYQDVLVALSADRRINNGQPSLHAHCLAALRAKDGETVLHIGAGTGYYSAVLAQLVGETGIVAAYEIDTDLAQQASANLAYWPNVAVHALSASEGCLGSYDIIYVSAGATHPPEIWLDALRPDGRLLLPLTPDEGHGGMLLLTRRHEQAFDARFVHPATFIPCSGARHGEMARALATAIARGNMGDVRSLRRGTAPDSSCWLAGNNWWLSTAELAST
jgi:protein-L-isoaspartate(D-aspartate) O-methyltransferase